MPRDGYIDAQDTIRQVPVVTSLGGVEDRQEQMLIQELEAQRLEVSTPDLQQVPSLTFEERKRALERWQRHNGINYLMPGAERHE